MNYVLSDEWREPRSKKKKDYVKSDPKTIIRQRRLATYRKGRIEELYKQIEEQKKEYEKVYKTAKRDARKEYYKKLRKYMQKFYRVRTAYKKFKERKGQRHRSIIHRTKYVDYNVPTKVKNFENICLQARQVNRDILGYLEFMMVTDKFVTSKREEFSLKENEFDWRTVVILLQFVVSGKPLYLRDVSVYGVSDGVKRRLFKKLEELKFIVRLNHVRYEITALGKDFINDYKNMISYGKSEVYELFKKNSGIIDNMENLAENFDEI